MRKQTYTIEKIQGQNRYVEMLKEKEIAFAAEIETQKDVLKKAQEAEEKAKEVMLKASQDFKALEKHKEKWAKEEKKKAEHAEEAEAEDISQAQYFTRQQEMKKE